MNGSRAHSSPSALAFVSGAEVRQVLEGREEDVVHLVQAGYEALGRGEAANPHSSFLPLPERPRCRIMALPAATTTVAGIKWVSSWPENLDAGLPRASAVIMLNDTTNGFPVACLEGTFINAARTAASAVLAARLLDAHNPLPRERVGFLGTGMIAREVHRYLLATGWGFCEIGGFDLNAERCESFLEDVAGGTAPVNPLNPVKTTRHDSPEDLIRNCDLLVIATVAATPHLTETSWFRHHPLVLHLSLRDLAPAVILDSVNVVDDADHCLRAGTSLSLTEQHVGDRAFVYGNLYDVLRDRIRWNGERTCVFSPFGLGTLDLFVARFVLEQVRAYGQLHAVEDFFAEVARGTPTTRGATVK